jgi:hypothetical protein
MARIKEASKDPSSEKLAGKLNSVSRSLMALRICEERFSLALVTKSVTTGVELIILLLSAELIYENTQQS